MVKYKVRLRARIEKGDPAYEEKRQAARRLLYSIDPKKLLEQTRNPENQRVQVSELMYEDDQRGGRRSHRKSVARSPSRSDPGGFTHNCVPNEWYHLPHPTLVLIPAVCKSVGGSYPEFQFSLIGLQPAAVPPLLGAATTANVALMDLHDSVVFDDVYVVKCRIKHTLHYNHKKPWFYDRVQRYMNLSKLVPTTIPTEVLLYSLEYMPHISDADVFYLLRRLLLRQRFTWARISHKVFLALSNSEAEPAPGAAPEESWDQADDVLSSAAYYVRPLSYRRWFAKGIDLADHGDMGGINWTLVGMGADCRSADFSGRSLLQEGLTYLLGLFRNTREPQPLTQVLSTFSYASPTQRRQSLIAFTESIRRRRASMTSPKANLHGSFAGRGGSIAGTGGSHWHLQVSEAARPSSFSERILEGLHVLDSMCCSPATGRELVCCGFRGWKCAADMHRQFQGLTFLHTLIDTSCLLGKSTKAVALRHAGAMATGRYSALFQENNLRAIASDSSEDSFLDEPLTDNTDAASRVWPFHIFFQLLDAADVVLDSAWQNKLRLGRCDPARFEMFSVFHSDMAAYRDRTEAGQVSDDSQSENYTTVDTESKRRKSNDRLAEPTNEASASTYHGAKAADKNFLKSATAEISKQDPFFRSLLIDHRSNGIRTFASLKSIFGFASSEYESVLAVLGALLHLRNVRFHIFHATDEYFVEDVEDTVSDEEPGTDTYTPETTVNPAIHQRLHSQVELAAVAAAVNPSPLVRRMSAAAQSTDKKRIQRGNSLFLTTDDFRNYTSAYILAATNTAQQPEKKLKLIQAGPCPISPQSVESVLVCCDLFKLPVVVVLALFSPDLAKALLAHSPGKNFNMVPSPTLKLPENGAHEPSKNELKLSECLYSPHNLGALHDFPARSTVFKDAPKLVYLTSHDQAETISLPPWLSAYDWLSYEECYIYRNHLLTEVYNGLFSFVRRKVNTCLQTKELLQKSEENPLLRLQNASAGCMCHVEMDFEDDTVFSDSFGHFLKTICIKRLRTLILENDDFKAGNMTASKEICDMLLNPKGPYSIKRLLRDYNEDPNTKESFSEFLIRNIPRDIPCGFVSRGRRRNKEVAEEQDESKHAKGADFLLQLLCQTRMVQYDTRNWGLLESSHLLNVLTLWKQYTTSATLKMIFDETRTYLKDIWLLMNDLLTSQITCLINIAYHQSCIDLFEKVCQYDLTVFAKRYHQQHAAWFSVSLFIKKYSVIMKRKKQRPIPARLEDVPSKAPRSQQTPSLASLQIGTPLMQSQSLHRFNDTLSSSSDSEPESPEQMVDNIMACVKLGRGGAPEYQIIMGRVYIHPQTMAQLEYQWFSIISRQVVRLQAIWRGNNVRRNYQALKQGNESARVIQDAYSRVIGQHWNYFEPPVFEGCRDGHSLYKEVLHHERNLEAVQMVGHVAKELSKMKEDAYLLSECDSMLNREENKISPMETLLTQILLENLKSQSIDELSSRLTKLKRQEALRKRIVKALKINDLKELEVLMKMIPEDIILPGLVKLKHDYELHRASLYNHHSRKSRSQTKLKSYIY